MARIRTIKPEFFTSEDIVSLTPLARVFYIALWCESDREGRLDWKPGTLKMRYLPGDDCNFASLADELISAGLIVLYEVDGKAYAEIPTFKTHQVINNREAESTRPSRHFDASARVKAEGKEGREGKRKGKEGEPRERDPAPSPKNSTKPRAQKTPLPADFAVSDRVAGWAKEHGFPDLEQHLEVFKRKAIAKGYTYASWDDAFMEAIRQDWAGIRAKAPQTFAQQAADVARTTVPARPGRDPVLEQIEADRAKAAPIPENIRAHMAKLKIGVAHA